MGKDKIRIALVEDHPGDMDALIQDFNRQGQIEVLHAFMTGADFLCHFHENSLDIDAAIIDYRLPILNGLETCRNLIAKEAPFKHLLVSHGYYQHVMQEMMALGSQNYCQKTSEKIHELLPRIIKGTSIYDHPNHIHEWSGITQQSSLQTKDESAWAGNLSPLEKKIIRSICLGEKSNKIAKALGYETSSIEKYRCAILKQLNLKNSQQLIAWAFSNGLITASLIFNNYNQPDTEISTEAILESGLNLNFEEKDMPKKLIRRALKKGESK